MMIEMKPETLHHAPKNNRGSRECERDFGTDCATKSTQQSAKLLSGLMDSPRSRCFGKGCSLKFFCSVKVSDGNFKVAQALMVFNHISQETCRWLKLLVQTVFDDPTAQLKCQNNLTLQFPSILYSVFSLPS